MEGEQEGVMDFHELRHWGRNCHTRPLYAPASRLVERVSLLTHQPGGSKQKGNNQVQSRPSDAATFLSIFYS